MAKLIYTAITSLDGYIEDEGGSFDWSAPDEDVHAFVNPNELELCDDQLRFGLWFGLWGPAGVPADIVNKISTDTRRALADPVVLERLRNTGNSALDMSPADFARFVRSEIEAYGRITRAAGIKPQ